MNMIPVKHRKWMLALISIYLILQFNGLFPLAAFYRMQNQCFYKKINEQREENMNFVRAMSGRVYPVLAYAGRNPVTELTSEEKEMLERILQEEALEGMEIVVEKETQEENISDEEALAQKNVFSEEETLGEQIDEEWSRTIQEEVAEENENTKVEEIVLPNETVSTVGRKQEFYESDFADYETILKRFYTVDPTTEAAREQISSQNLLDRNMALSHKNGEGEAPQILIYHTHSQEQFVDSIPGDISTGVVGAGEYLTQILEQQYGYQVLHHLGMYDVNGREHAYSNAEPEIAQLLKDNPEIEVVIDLHRDAVTEGSKLVTTIDGVTMAKFMFFNGLSYTKELGRITYLNNPYIDENLAFAFQMDVTAESYYPGITRKIYLKGYRYNMHFKEKTLLIELGAQTNTMQEIWNAIPPIADTLNRVLSGEEPAIQE